MHDKERDQGEDDSGLNRVRYDHRTQLKVIYQFLPDKTSRHVSHGIEGRHLNSQSIAIHAYEYPPYAQYRTRGDQKKHLNFVSRYIED